MKTPDNKPSSDTKFKLNKHLKSTDALPLPTWILLIISFTLLGYAIYSIQTRILEAPVETTIPKSSVTPVQ